MSTSPLPPDPYEALGVSRDADIETIKRAHRKLVLKHHPDRVSDRLGDSVRDLDLIEEHKNKFQRVQEAYELLIDPVLKSRYDGQCKLAQLRKERMISHEFQPKPQSSYVERTPNSYFEAYEEPPLPWYANKSEAYERQTSTAKPPEKKEKERSTKQSGWERPVAGLNIKNAFSFTVQAARAKKTVDRDQEERRVRAEKVKTPRYSAYVEEHSTSESSEGDTVLTTGRRPTAGARSPAPPRNPRGNPSPEPVPRRRARGGQEQLDERRREREEKYRARREEQEKLNRRINYKPPICIDTDEDDNDFYSKWEQHHADSKIYIAQAQRAPRNTPARNKSRNGSDNDYYYSGRTSGNRAKKSRSVRSRDSSTNMSLGDGRRHSFSREYQSPDFARRRAGSASSYEIERRSPGLPPKPRRQRSLVRNHEERPSGDRTRQDPRATAQQDPGATAHRPPELHRFKSEPIPRPSINTHSPVVRSRLSKLHSDIASSSTKPLPQKPDTQKHPETATGEPSTRECYLCNSTITIARNKDWQKHVFGDLKPYQCIEESCPEAQISHGQLKMLRQHYKEFHPLATILASSPYSCLFCEEPLSTSAIARFKHIGRHLEDIAFSTIPRRYEDWKFYSDSESPPPSPIRQKQANTKVDTNRPTYHNLKAMEIFGSRWSKFFNSWE